MEWSREQIVHLIELYRDKQVLWNTTHSEFKNKDLKNCAWNDISTEMNVDKAEMQTKMKSLISQFQRETKKMINGNEQYKTNWCYFSSLDFLKEKTIHRNTIGSGIANITIETQVSTVPALSTPSTSSFVEPPRQKRKLIPYTPTAKDLLAKATCYLEMEDDECLTLAKAYATKLRKLTPQQLMFADKVINDTLLDAQMGLLTKNTYLIHTVPSSPPQTSSWNSHFMNSS